MQHRNGTGAGLIPAGPTSLYQFSMSETSRLCVNLGCRLTAGKQIPLPLFTGGCRADLSPHELFSRFRRFFVGRRRIPSRGGGMFRGRPVTRGLFCRRCFVHPVSGRMFHCLLGRIDVGSRRSCIRVVRPRVVRHGRPWRIVSQLRRGVAVQVSPELSWRIAVHRCGRRLVGSRLSLVIRDGRAAYGDRRSNRYDLQPLFRVHTHLHPAVGTISVRSGSSVAYRRMTDVLVSNGRENRRRIPADARPAQENQAAVGSSGSGSGGHEILA